MLEIRDNSLYPTSLMGYIGSSSNRRDHAPFKKDRIRIARADVRLPLPGGDHVPDPGPGGEKRHTEKIPRADPPRNEERRDALQPTRCRGRVPPRQAPRFDPLLRYRRSLRRTD